LDVWTDGTITPTEAVRKASDVLVNHFFLFSSLGKGDQVPSDGLGEFISPEAYQTPIEKLGLSPRTLNCLRRAHITKVGQVLETPHEEFLKIRNFGERSLKELLSKLKMLNLDGSSEQRASYEIAEKEEEGLEESYGLAEGLATMVTEGVKADDEENDEDEEDLFDDDDDEAEEGEA
jgi:DNA-directed RNA polymerase subunit alpha